MRLLKGLASHALPCGCQVGTYETLDGPILNIIDSRAHDCPEAQHRPGLVVAPPLVGRESEQYAIGVL
jgi:hypothetical protein